MHTWPPAPLTSAHAAVIRLLAEPPQWIPKTAVRGRLSERFFGNTVAHGSAHVNGEAALYTVHEKEKKTEEKRSVHQFEANGTVHTSGGQQIRHSTTF